MVYKNRKKFFKKQRDTKLNIMTFGNRKKILILWFEKDGIGCQIHKKQRDKT